MDGLEELSSQWLRYRRGWVIQAPCFPEIEATTVFPLPSSRPCREPSAPRDQCRPGCQLGVEELVSASPGFGQRIGRTGRPEKSRKRAQ